MTNWRERGYVPASDGDDSEVELSTQEEEEEEPYELLPPPTHLENASKNEPHGNGNGEGTTDGTATENLEPNGAQGATTQGDIRAASGAVQSLPAAASDDGFMDIDEALGRPSRAVASNSQAVVIPANIAVLDLSHDMDEEDGGVALQVRLRMLALCRHL